MIPFERPNRIFRGLAVLSVLVLASGCTMIGRSSVARMGDNANGALILSSQTAFAEPLSRTGRRKLAEAEKQALDFGRAGQPIAWEGRRGRTGTVTAFQPFRVGQAMCRRIEHTLNLPDGPRTAAATACRRSNGPWELVN